MTIETKCLAPVSEADKIEITCAIENCDGMLCLRLKPGCVQAAQNCPNCGAVWWFSPNKLDTPIYRLVMALIEYRTDQNPLHPNATIVFPGPKS